MRLILIVGMPILSILIYFITYGAAIGDSAAIKIGIVNQDKGVYTTELTRLIKEEPVSVTEVSKVQGEKELLGGQKDALIIMKKGSDQALADGKPAHFAVKALQSENTTKSVERILAAQIEKLSKMAQVGSGQEFSKISKIYQANQLEVKNTNIINRQEVSKNMSAQIIGFLCMMLLYAAGSLGELLLKEKEEGTFYRLMSTPLGSKAYIFGHALFAFATLLFEILFCLLLMKFAFQIDPGLSYLKLFLLLAVFAVFAVSISLAFGFLSKSRRSLSSVQTTVFTLSTMLSGALIPIAIMPAFMQKIAEFMPQYWIMDAISQLQQNGSMFDLGLNLLVLSGYTLFFFSLASYKFTKNEELNSFV